MVRVKPDQIGSAIKKVLTLYHQDVNDAIKVQTRKHMRDLVKETKSQKYKEDTGKYLRAISSKVLSQSMNELTMVWYVKPPYYRLSHLLEYGHNTRSGGRTIAYGTIGKASERVIANYLKDVEEAIGNVK